MARNGKPIKARRIGGVKVVPKWNWTQEYATEVAKHSRALSKGPYGKFMFHGPGPGAWRENYLAGAYRDWLRCERMPNLTPDEATQLINNQRQAA